MMKKIGSIAGVVLVLAFAGVLTYLRCWNLVGQNDLGEACSNRGGCKTFWCLSHALGSGSAKPEHPSAGYCTDKCDADADCGAGMKCVAPPAAAADDLAKLGRPDKLCERVE